jgi:2-isopropylmalate synthase
MAVEYLPHMNNRVWIFDTTLRDGEQSPGCSMTVPEKLLMAGKLVELGVDILEAGFPIASQGDFEAVDAVSREFPWAQVAALGALQTRRRARRQFARKSPPPPHPHLHRHQRYSSQVQAQEIPPAGSRRRCRRRRARPLLRGRRRVFRRRWRPHRSRISGKDLPRRSRRRRPHRQYSGYRRLFRARGVWRTDRRIVKALGDTAVVSVHCHDDLGLAVANSLAAVQAGARQIECTINGIGERAGNCSLEEIVMIMKTRHDRYPWTPAFTPSIFSPPARCSVRSSVSARSRTKPSSARNAFAHEAGIHQDGYLKERTTYEIMDPKSVGVPEAAGPRQTQRPPRAEESLRRSGVQPDPEELDLVYQRITALADNKKGLMDEEIAELARAQPAREQALSGDFNRKIEAEYIGAAR